MAGDVADQWEDQAFYAQAEMNEVIVALKDRCDRPDDKCQAHKAPDFLSGSDRYICPSCGKAQRCN